LIQKLLAAFIAAAVWLLFKEAVAGWQYAHLIDPSIPMGGGIAADVFAVTLINAILFPEMFRRWWPAWVLAVGGSHALLPIVGQLTVIYLEPALLAMGVAQVWLEVAKTAATITGCWLLWKFLVGVFEDGVLGTSVAAFAALTFAAVWGCSADALYSGAVKGAPALEYGWNFTEIIISNAIAATVVMLAAGVATIGGLKWGHLLRKPKWQIGAFYIEFAVLGYFLVFFILNRAVGLHNWYFGSSFDMPKELMAFAISFMFVGWLFWSRRDEIVLAQKKRLGLEPAEA